MESRARSPAAAQQRALQERTSRGSPAPRAGRAASGSVSAETKGMKARPPVPKLRNLPRHPSPGGLRFYGAYNVETHQKRLTFHCRVDTRHVGRTPGSGGRSQGPSEQGPVSGKWMRRAWSSWGPAAGTRLLGKASRGLHLSQRRPLIYSLSHVLHFYWAKHIRPVWPLSRLLSTPHRVAHPASYSGEKRLQSD